MPSRPLQALGAVAVALCAVLTVGTAPQAAPIRDQIRVVGSSTMFNMTSRVAETFGRTSPHRTPVVESTGTGGGFQMFCGGLGRDYPDVVMASRPITAAERQACADNDVREIVEIPVGYGGVIVVNARSAPDFSVTRRQLWLAVAETVPVDGEMTANPFTRWSEIDPGLPDLPIEVYGPPPTSGTHDAFLGMVLEQACLLDPTIQRLPAEARRDACLRLREDGRYIHAGEFDDSMARRVAANPQAVGIVGFHVLDETPELKPAMVDGMKPTFATLMEHTYPLVRKLRMYVKAGHVGVVPGLGEFVRTFVADTAIGPDGYLTDIGLVPLPAQVRDLSRDAAWALDAGN